jgi:hypothetical protein
MKLDITVNAKPFDVPAKIYCTNPTGDSWDNVYPLDILNYNELDKMCDEFRKSIFKEAGVEDIKWKKYGIDT